MGRGKEREDFFDYEDSKAMLARFSGKGIWKKK
jgi:hypothetical protein